MKRYNRIIIRNKESSKCFYAYSLTACNSIVISIWNTWYRKFSPPPSWYLRLRGAEYCARPPKCLITCWLKITEHYFINVDLFRMKRIYTHKTITFSRNAPSFLFSKTICLSRVWFSALWTSAGLALLCPHMRFLRFNLTLLNLKTWPAF